MAKRMVRPKFVLEDKPKLGWREVYLVNERGRRLGTEAVCAYPVEEHDWFGKWLVKQEVPVELPDVEEQAKKILATKKENGK